MTPFQEAIMQAGIMFNDFYDPCWSFIQPDTKDNWYELMCNHYFRAALISKGLI